MTPPPRVEVIAVLAPDNRFHLALLENGQLSQTGCGIREYERIDGLPRDVPYRALCVTCYGGKRG